jgi:hypothetical protein
MKPALGEFFTYYSSYSPRLLLLSFDGGSTFTAQRSRRVGDEENAFILFLLFSWTPVFVFDPWIDVHVRTKQEGRTNEAGG